MHIDDTPRSWATQSTTARRGVIAALAAVAAAGMMSACGSSSSSSISSTPAKVNLNTPHVAHAIELSILSERHVHATVSCPATIKQEQGKRFVCIATTHDSNGVAHKTPFAVTEQNGKGYVTYKAE